MCRNQMRHDVQVRIQRARNWRRGLGFRDPPRNRVKSMKNFRLIWTVIASLNLLLLGGCATTGAHSPSDPLQRMNRATFRFNSAVDRAIFKPAAMGYRNHVPQAMQKGIDNFLTNLSYPTTIVNDLLQMKLKDTLIDIGRFAVNSTIGIGGFLDPATKFGMPRNREDFGQSLGRWGVPAGPYIVLPFFGPSSLRDAPSFFLADVRTDLRVGPKVDREVEWTLIGLSIVNRRAQLLPFDAAVDSAHDRYAFIRDAWSQRREYQVKDGKVSDVAPPDDPDVSGGVEPPPPIRPSASRSLDTGGGP